jgi:tetratricopeptide (TPR) repeat protein
MKNAPCISNALVALGRLRISQALEISVHVTDQKDRKTFNEVEQELNNTRNRFLKRAKATLIHALELEGLEAETKFEGQLALAHTLLLLGELDASYDCATDTLKEAYQYEFIWGYARCQLLLGRILARQGQQEQAENYFEQAMRVFLNCGARLEYASTLYNYGVALMEYRSAEKNKYQQGLSYMQEAYKIFEASRATLELLRIEHDISKYKDRRG